MENETGDDFMVDMKTEPEEMQCTLDITEALRLHELQIRHYLDQHETSIKIMLEEQETRNQARHDQLLELLQHSIDTVQNVKKPEVHSYERPEGLPMTTMEEFNAFEKNAEIQQQLSEPGPSMVVSTSPSLVLAPAVQEDPNFVECQNRQLTEFSLPTQNYSTATPSNTVINLIPVQNAEASNTEIQVQDTDLKKWIEQHPVLNRMIESFNKTKMLNKSQRKSLSRELILKEFQGQKEIKFLPGKRFLEIAQSIVDTFPGEDIDMFYTHYKPKTGPADKRLVPTGTLYTVVKNLRSVARSMHNSQGLLIETENEAEVVDSESIGMEESVNFLRQNVEPLSDIQKHWIKTKSWRKAFDGSTKEYFRMFPCLKQNFGFFLLVNDFDNDYPQSTLNLIQLWPKLRPQLIKLLITNPKIKEDGFALLANNLIDRSIDEHTLDATVLCLLPLLFKKPGGLTADKSEETDEEFDESRLTSEPENKIRRISQKKNDFRKGHKELEKEKKWNPTKEEVMSGFLHRIESSNNLQEEVEKLRNSVATWKIEFQPRPLVVGAVNKIVSSYVVTDEVVYKSGTPLQAFEVAFKIIFALKAKYPRESKPAWLFMQRAIYKIETKDYLTYVGGNTIREALNQFMKESVTDRLIQGFCWTRLSTAPHRTSRPFYNTKLARVMFDAVNLCQRLETCDRIAFAAHMKEVLRTAKQRGRDGTKRRTSSNISVFSRKCYLDEMSKLYPSDDEMELGASGTNEEDREKEVNGVS